MTRKDAEAIIAADIQSRIADLQIAALCGRLDDVIVASAGLAHCEEAERQPKDMGALAPDDDGVFVPVLNRAQERRFREAGLLPRTYRIAGTIPCG